jgi:hypothetical protein
MKIIKNYTTFINENKLAGNNNEAYYDKLRGLIEKKGARQVAIDIVNKCLGFISASELPDTAIYADGLDTIEEYLNNGMYKEALEQGKETAKEMLEDEGFGDIFGESVVNEGKEHKFADKLEDMATNSKYLTQDEKDDFEAPIYTKIGMWAMSIFDKLKLKDKEITKEDYDKAFSMIEDKLKNRKPPKAKKIDSDDTDDDE